MMGSQSEAAGTSLRELCLALMEADREKEVVRLLKEAGYWDDPEVWRPYGDTDYNYSTVGNQQSRPEAALVEKLVNAVDAKLIGACLEKGLEPESDEAPDSVRGAVARFFSPTGPGSGDDAGHLTEWSPSDRTEVARGITLSATGFKPGAGSPCFTIADDGEGQTPRRLPETILSLDKKNKQYIRFVQGRFNMGGTGALKFCGHHNLQLVVTRRNPRIIGEEEPDPSDDEWAFTVVRREDPEGAMRNSVYTYLAPRRVAGEKRVLSFPSPSMPIFPKGQQPYARESEHGTLIKLYEYSTSAWTHMFRKGGIQERLDLLLPEVGLPIRLHECRDYRGSAERSFETTVSGLIVRLDEGSGDNLEPSFPSSCPISDGGQRMVAKIYAFKKEKADTYRRNEGVIFILHGQTHGHLTKDFFRRRSVGLSYLASDILVLVDCSEFVGRAREDLFMNSRDRLSKGKLYESITKSLEVALKEHKGLRELKERRRREEISKRLDDSRPLENVLDSIFERAPSLANLFLKGKRISAPFKSRSVASEEKPFEGRRFPRFFKFKGKEYGVRLQRQAHLGARFRVTFETDAVNDYFERTHQKGRFTLRLGGSAESPPFVGPNLHDGIATLNVALPEDIAVGAVLEYTAEVTDPDKLKPLVNVFEVTVLEERPTPHSDPGTRRKPPADKKGKDRESSAGIQLPEVIEVRQEQWSDQGFNAETALVVKDAGVSSGDGDGESPAVYDFFVNVDNIYLQAHLKSSSGEGMLATARFKYGLVLIGLGMLHDDLSREGSGENGEADPEAEKPLIEERIQRFTQAIAPILLPMIDSLGELRIEDVRMPTTSGEPDD